MARLVKSANWNQIYTTAAGEIKTAIQETLIPKIKAALVVYYMKTFRYWSGVGITASTGYRPVYPVPFMYFDYSIVFQSKSIVLKIKTLATTGGGQPNTLWYWLDDGTDNYVQQRNSPPIPEYTSVRTTPDTLDVSAGRAYTGRYFRIREGTLRKGIAARNWSYLIGKYAIADLKPDLDKFGFAINKIVINGATIRSFD